jgi:hypothetical protein
MRSDDEYRKIQENITTVRGTANVVESVLRLWGITYDEVDDKFIGKAPSYEEESRSNTHSYTLEQFEEEVQRAIENAMSLYKPDELIAFWRTVKDALYVFGRYEEAKNVSFSYRFRPDIEFKHDVFFDRAEVVSYCFEVTTKVRRIDDVYDTIEEEDEYNGEYDEKILVEISVGDKNAATIIFRGNKKVTLDELRDILAGNIM